MTIEQRKAKRSSLLLEASAIANKASTGRLVAEQRRLFDNIMQQAESLQNDIVREERNTARPPRSQPGEFRGSSNVEAQKRAFTDWMRTGQITLENRSHLRTAETRDLGVGAVGGVITGGNVLVPVGFDPQLHAAQKSYGQIVSVVRQLKTDTGGPLRVALTDDTAQSLSVIGEATAVAESDPNLSGFTSYTDELTTGLVKVSNSLLQDSAFNVDDWIEQIFGARYYRGLAKMISQGNGSNIQPITAGAAVGATSLAASVGYLDLVALYASLDPAYIENASFVMTSTTRATLMAVEDGYGRPVLQSDVNGQPFNAIFGRPIVISQFTDPIAATKMPILFGDMSAYTLRTAGTLQVARLTERYAELNETGFIGYCRAGGYGTSQTTAPAIVGLRMHA